jgi:hypothetical protein
MRYLKVSCLIVVATLGLLLTTGEVSALPLSAAASFAMVGGNLQVVLTNTDPGDVGLPTQVLTALFFDIAGNPTLTPISATLGTSTVLFGPDGGGNVGGEWAYAAGLSGAPGGAKQGISSSGFGLFGDPNFGGASLDPPTAVDGLNYGLTSAGDNPATGNAEVTGNVPLIKNQVTFLLGVPGSFTPTNISNVHFQYGTALNENPPVAEPGTLLLLGSGLLLTAGLTVRCRCAAK